MSSADKPATAIIWIFSGLPGTGKTTLARRLAQSVNAFHLRIDTIEQALRDVCQIDVTAEGYDIAYRIAADNLRLGVNVVADSCNPLELTRREWEQVASSSGAKFVNIELICSDADEHRHRIESRESDIPQLNLPSWSDVTSREYDLWTSNRIILDTASRSEEDSFAALMAALAIA